MSDLLTAALGYARMGWPVFPLHTPSADSCSCSKGAECDRRGKHPRTPNGLTDASTDEATICAWWAKWPAANVGVRTGNGLVVVDVDSAERVELEGKLPPTRRVHTGRGRHYYFKGEAKSGQNVYGPGVDVRGAGGYVVAPPSLHSSGARYEWDPSCELVAELPDLGPKKSRRAVAAATAAASAVAALDPGRRRIARARAWLAKRDPAVEGKGGSTDTMTTAIEVLAFVQGDRATALSLLRPWNVTCQPPWPEDLLARKVDEAAKADILPALMARREQELDELRKPDPTTSQVGTIKAGVDLHRVVDEAEAALGLELGTYQRSGMLVHVIRTEIGEASIRQMRSATVAERLTKICTFEKYDARKDGWIACEPPGSVVDALCARGEWPDVRYLRGVVETPTLVADGSVLQSPGYDEASGYLLIPSGSFPAVADAPGYEDALLALRKLDEVFVDFPFAEEAHRSAALAYLLTLMARPAIHGPVPAFAVDATTPGTGKSLLTKVVGIIATGSEPGMTSTPTDETEWRKLITTVALEGGRMVCLDNLNGRIESSSLDSVLTSGRWRDRVLGSSATVNVAVSSVWSLTGNNMQLGGDLARRVITCRLESPLERPEERTDFRHPHLAAWVAVHRPRLAAAALTVLRAYHVAGRPVPAGWTPLGTFEAWTNLVAGALVWLGRPNPLDGRPQGGDQDAKIIALRGVLLGLRRLDPSGVGASAAEIVNELWPPGGMPSERPGHAELRTSIEVLCPVTWGRSPSAKSLGMVFRYQKRRVIGGMMLDSVMDNHGVARWVVVTAGDFRSASGSTGSSRVTSTPLPQTVIADEQRQFVEPTQNRPG